MLQRSIFHASVKIFGHLTFQIASLNDKYEVPKDFVNHTPFKNAGGPGLTARNQRAARAPGHGKGAQNFYGGVHIATLESNPLDVVYSDPKDSKLYQVPGGDPKPVLTQVELESPYKVYVSSGREAQYCRPYMTVTPSAVHPKGRNKSFLNGIWCKGRNYISPWLIGLQTLAIKKQKLHHFSTL